MATITLFLLMFIWLMTWTDDPAVPGLSPIVAWVLSAVVIGGAIAALIALSRLGTGQVERAHGVANACHLPRRRVRPAVWTW